jgi:pyridoxal phosphate enzyme (YggS family)
MAVNVESYKNIVAELNSKKVTLVAVSKTKSAEEILALYDMGQRDFGENYVQELVEKYEHLPKDIRWHFIGHLQSNKVKLIAPFVYLVHSVDSEKLLKEINQQSEKNNRIIDCLLQVHIAKEETKFGFDEKELDTFFQETLSRNDTGLYKNIRIVGLMGMASFSDDRNLVRNEFQFLKSLFTKNATFSILNSQFSILSMGMSSDYELAIEEGANMVRIGSLLFGKREPKK